MFGHMMRSTIIVRMPLSPGAKSPTREGGAAFSQSCCFVQLLNSAGVKEAVLNLVRLLALEDLDLLEVLEEVDVDELDVVIDVFVPDVLSSIDLTSVRSVMSLSLASLSVSSSLVCG